MIKQYGDTSPWPTYTSVKQKADRLVPKQELARTLKVLSYNPKNLPLAKPRLLKALPATSQNSSPS